MITKPDTPIAMRKLIADIRSAIPFDTPQEKLCNGPCTGCAKKLLDYLDMQLEEKESEINAGIIPNLGELNRLKKSAMKIHATLIKNGLIKNE
ncbi:hypothetical protein KDX31_19025 [Amphritea atlantica]|uniref:BFD-like [2Fe-2S] binding domain-containing protein n=1 Tax=Amphritea atlantica TaxID=355243 RepID=A0ABY5GVV8_9GAMM|nr:hypothetical protein KDX31_19025 [Amphritea atlantica]